MKNNIKEYVFSISALVFLALLLTFSNSKVALATSDEWYSSLYEQNGSSENITALFNHSIEGTTMNTYSGYVGVEISNFG